MAATPRWLRGYAELVEEAHDPCASDREVGRERRAFAGAVIDEAQAAKPAAGPQGVAREVHRPALIAPLGHTQPEALTLRRAAAPAAAAVRFSALYRR